jgi:hypothetical protein
MGLHTCMEGREAWVGFFNDDPWLETEEIAAEGVRAVARWPEEVKSCNYLLCLGSDRRSPGRM